MTHCRQPSRAVDEAFERFLKKNRPGWVPKEKITAQEALDLIHQAGGLAVVAHPGLARTEEALPGIDVHDHPPKWRCGAPTETNPRA